MVGACLVLARPVPRRLAHRGLRQQRATAAAAAPRRAKSPVKSPVPARPRRRRPRKPGSPNSRTQTPARRSPTTRSGPAAVANSSSPAASPTPAATRRSPKKKANSSKAMKRCEPGELVEVPAYISPIAIIYNLARRRRTETRPGNPGEDLQPGNHQLERPGDRQRQPGVELPDTRDHPGQPLRRVGHDGELHRLPLRGRPQRLEVRSQRRLAGQGRRGRRGHLRCGRSGHRRRRRDRLRRRQPGRRTRHRQDQGRQRIRRTDARRPRRKSSRSRPKTKELAKDAVHDPVRSRSQDRIAGHLPDHPGLLPDRPARNTTRPTKRRSSRPTSNT